MRLVLRLIPRRCCSWTWWHWGNEFKASLGQMVRMVMEEEEEKTRKLKSYLDMVAYA